MNEVTIWRVLDGKAGHEAQSLGFARAVERRVAARVVDVPALSPAAALRAWLGRSFPGQGVLPRPDLIVGAGHATHLALLAARRSVGGRVVVLMRPSLPLGWFDRAVVPEHDGGPRHPRVVRSEGALNAMRPAAHPRRDRGLILVGGPSKHCRWDGERLLRQIERIAASESGVEWTVTDSRRTPAATSAALRDRADGRWRFVSREACDPGWMGRRLDECARVWVSEDSVSMIYEALTAGAGVGLLDVPWKREASRIRRSLRRLEERGRVARFSETADNDLPEPQVEPLAEADRCADLILRDFGLA